jgi:hypothetical protein
VEDKKMNKNIIRASGVYAAILAAVFGITGLLEVGAGLGLIDEIDYIPADLFGGLSLMVIAAVYIKGVLPLLSAKTEGLSYLFVGALVCFAISGLYIAMLSAAWFGENVVSALDVGEELGDMEALAKPDAKDEYGGMWDLMDDFRIESLYFLLALPGYILSKNIRRFETC